MFINFYSVNLYTHISQITQKQWPSNHCLLTQAVNSRSRSRDEFEMPVVSVHVHNFM